MTKKHIPVALADAHASVSESHVPAAVVHWSARTGAEEVDEELLLAQYAVFGTMCLEAEALSRHEPQFFESSSRIEEAVRGDQVHPWVLGPTREEFPEDSRSCALSHSDASGETNHVRHLGNRVTEERGASAIEDPWCAAV